MTNEPTELEGANVVSMQQHHLTAGENAASAMMVRKESPVLQEEPQIKRIKVEAAASPAMAPPAALAAAALPQNIMAASAGVVVKKNPSSNQMLLAASGHSKQNLGGGEKVLGEQAGVAIKKEAGPSAASSIVTVSPMADQSASNSVNSSSATSLHEPAHKNSENYHPAAGAVQAPPVQAPAAAAADDVPLKSTTMSHLRTKYTSELDYMLREFRKLERQLLGAKGASQLEESAGSRERREKLHSFILHLEDTLRQIELGFKLEAEGKSTANVGVTTSNHNDMNTNANANSTTNAPPAAAADEVKKQQLAEQAALTNLTQEKEEEENVQKLEEHILANLLPVQVRLKKQLAAQQGATKNPAGMPGPRRGMLQPSATAELGKGTFAAAAEQRRKQAEEARQEQEHAAASRLVTDPTQFGKPLSGGGSSLTQKLHGDTLGSNARTHGDGVGTSPKPATAAEVTERPERQILYAGMVPQSKQRSSGVAAASGVHEMVIEDPTLLHESKSSPGRKQEGLAASSSVQLSKPIQAAAPQQPTAPSKPAAPSEDGDESDMDKKPDTSELTLEEIRKLRKRRRKKKLLRLGRQREKERRRQLALHQQAVQAAQTPSAVIPGRKKGTGGKGQGKGPRSVEYICALCSEAYSSTCDYNPWWALTHHECPKCRKHQVRIVGAFLCVGHACSFVGQLRHLFHSVVFRSLVSISLLLQMQLNTILHCLRTLMIMAEETLKNLASCMSANRRLYQLLYFRQNQPSRLQQSILLYRRATPIRNQISVICLMGRFRTTLWILMILRSISNPCRQPNKQSTRRLDTITKGLFSRMKTHHGYLSSCVTRRHALVGTS